MPDNPEAVIRQAAEEIRQLVIAKATTLHGIRFDPANADHMLIAAYCVGLAQGQESGHEIINWLVGTRTARN